jgi:WD40 repeat protein
MAHHPKRPLLAIAGSDSSIVLWPLDGGEKRKLLGHQTEVNGVEFLKNGKQLISISDDTTVRVWDTETGSAYWRAPALLPSPPTLVSHRGWLTLNKENVKQDPRASKAWAKDLVKNATAADASTSTDLLCTQNRNGEIVLWNRKADQLLARTKVSEVRHVLALDDRCVVHTDRSAIVIKSNGETARLNEDHAITAIASSGNDILLASDRKVRLLDSDGNVQAEYAVGSGPTAIAMATHGEQKRLIVGYRDGAVEFYPIDGPRQFEAQRIERATSSAVVSLKSNDTQLLAVGHGDGTFALWDLAGRRQIDQMRLHGSARHLLFTQDNLHAATDLGQHHTWPISLFTDDRCTVMKQVWDSVQITWNDGRTVPSPRPQTHDCLARTP